MIVFLCALLTMFLAYPAQSEGKSGLNWQKTFGGKGYDGGRSIAEVKPGTLWIVGENEKPGGPRPRNPLEHNSDFTLVSYDEKGKQGKTVRYGGSRYDAAAAIAATGDGGALVMGTTRSKDGNVKDRTNTNETADVWAVRLNEKAEIVWSKSLGGNGNDIGHSVSRASDGSFFLGGDTQSTDLATEIPDGSLRGCGGNRDFYLAKLSPEGQLQWERSIGGTNNEYLSQVLATADGGALLIGRTESEDRDVSGFMGEYDAWLVKVTSEGRIEWSRTLGGDLWDWGSSIQEGSDGSIFALGYTYSWDRDGQGNRGDYDFFLVKLSSTGERIWSRTYGGSVDDFAHSLVSLPNGQMVALGASASNDGQVDQNRGSFDYYAILLSKEGDFLGERTWGGSEYEIPHLGASSIVTSSGAIVVTGETESSDGDIRNPRGNYDFWTVSFLPGNLNPLEEKRRVEPKEMESNRLNSPGAPITWSRTWGGEGDDRPQENPQAIAQSPKGGFAFLATTKSQKPFLAKETDLLVVRTDERGDTLWTRTFGGSGAERGGAILSLPDGGFALFASTSSPENLGGPAKGNMDLWLLRLNEEGNLLWQKRWGGAESDFGESIALSPNGGFYLGATIYRESCGGRLGAQDMAVMELDANGNILWQKDLGGNGNDTLSQLIVTKDGGLALIGKTESENLDALGNHGMYDILVARLDSKGTKLWSQVYGGWDWEWGTGILELGNGDFMVSGYTYSFEDLYGGQPKGNHGEWDYWVLRLSGKGDLLWQKCFGGANYEIGYGLVQVSPDRFAMVGGSPSLDGQVKGNQGKWDGWIIGFDGKGRLLWNRSIGGSAYDAAYALVRGKNGDLVILGETQSADGDFRSNAGHSDISLVRMPWPN
jgi:hypothetical protein